MDSHEAITIANAVLLSIAGRPLSDIERHVLIASLDGKSYEEMALGWSPRTLKDTGSRLWRYLSQALGGDVKVSKSCFQAALLRLSQDRRYLPPLQQHSAIGRSEIRPEAWKASEVSSASDTEAEVRPQQSGLLDINTSPFITGTPILSPRLFFGRQKILKRLFNLLQTHPLQNAAIIGPRRSGKTSLLNYLRTITTASATQLRPGQRCDWLPNAAAYRWVFVDFQDARMAHRERLLSYLLQSMQLPVPEQCDLECFMDSVSDNVPVPTVILMDEIGVGLQYCPELDDSFWESLRALATNQTGGNLAFVLSTPENPMDLARHAGHGSPFFNIFGYIAQLGPLTRTEAQSLIMSSPLPFSEADTNWILEKSESWPLLLQILCQERLYSLQEQETSEDWKREGLQQVRPFHHLLDASSSHHDVS